MGPGLDPEVVARYGGAFGQWMAEEYGRGRVLVARDSRTSGSVFVQAASAGLRATGHHVVDLGLCPTPTALLAVEDDPGAVGGLVVTASHNPVEWNGLKLVSSEGVFLRSEAGEAVQARFEEGPDWTDWDGLGGMSARDDAVIHHVGRILDLEMVHPERIREARLSVALDCVRGAAGVALPGLLERLGCRVEGIHVEPDGRFPRDPEPRPENLEELSALVREGGADLGMAVDPDGDRLVLVDGEGRPLGEEATLPLAAELVLSHTPGPVVTNLSTSQLVEDVARAHGQEVHRTPVGEAHVAEGMERLGAPVGGEGIGGVMLAELHATRDAPLAAALVLELLAERGSTLREIVAGWPEYHMVRDRTPVPDRPLEDVYAAVRGSAPAGGEEDRRDGLRIAWPSGRRWLHVRPSGTEPILRIMAEGPDREAAEELVETARESLKIPTADSTRG